MARFIERVIVGSLSGFDQIVPGVLSLVAGIGFQDGDGQRGNRRSFNRTQAHKVVADRGLGPSRNVAEGKIRRAGNKQGDRVVIRPRSKSRHNNRARIGGRFLEMSSLRILVKETDANVAFRLDVQVDWRTADIIQGRNLACRLSRIVQSFIRVNIQSKQVIAGQFAGRCQRGGLGGGSQFQLCGFEPDPIDNQCETEHDRDQCNRNRGRRQPMSTVRLTNNSN